MRGERSAQFVFGNRIHSSASFTLTALVCGTDGQAGESPPLLLVSFQLAETQKFPRLRLSLLLATDHPARDRKPRKNTRSSHLWPTGAWDVAFSSARRTHKILSQLSLTPQQGLSELFPPLRNTERFYGLISFIFMLVNTLLLKQTGFFPLFSKEIFSQTSWQRGRLNLPSRGTHLGNLLPHLP